MLPGQGGNVLHARPAVAVSGQRKPDPPQRGGCNALITEASGGGHLTPPDKTTARAALFRGRLIRGDRNRQAKKNTGASTTRQRRNTGAQTTPATISAGVHRVI
jgi:hypothetical protein